MEGCGSCPTAVGIVSCGGGPLYDGWRAADPEQCEAGRTKPRSSAVLAEQCQADNGEGAAAAGAVELQCLTFSPDGHFLASGDR